MAYVWIGSVRHTRMNKTVNYAVNPVKTAYDSKAAEEASMTANIAYALNAEKGTTRLFQTAVNLDGIETAWDEMREAKERWGKTDGIQGFHVVQSFAPGEATPELAHKIGVEFVERCFPDFQAVIGTHLDKHHIHNHIVLNSVSYVDGHKYHSSQKSYYNELRKVSDELCRKHGLSIIKSGINVPDHSRHYAEWKAENEGRPTWCSAIKEDVDAAIASSATFEQFIRQLKAMGYEVKTNVKHMAVRPPGKERFTRLRRLGDNYTEEAIRRRIQQQDHAEPTKQTIPATWGHLPLSYHGRYRGSWSKGRRSKVGGLRGLYLWYAFKMGVVRKSGTSSRKTHYLLREDIRKLEKRERMASLLVKNRIETFDQLHAHQDECRRLISVLCDERAKLWGKHTPEAEARLAVIREQLKTLRNEVRTCDEIEEDSVLLEQKRQALRSSSSEKPQKRTRVQQEK